MIVLSKFADILQTFFKVRYKIESCLGGGYIAEPPITTYFITEPYRGEHK